MKMVWINNTVNINIFLWNMVIYVSNYLDQLDSFVSFIKYFDIARGEDTLLLGQHNLLWKYVFNLKTGIKPAS